MTDFDALMPEDEEDDVLLMPEDKEEPYEEEDALLPGDGKSTVVGMVLDRSGSMLTMWDEAVGAYNGQIEEFRNQLSTDDEILMVGTVFDTVVDVVLKGVPVQDAEDLPKHVQPRGLTALYDAIGFTINEMQDTKVENDDKAYLLVVITDGLDNASKIVTQKKLASMLKELEDSGEWTVVFIGSDREALADAAALGFGANTHALDPNAEGMDAVAMSLRSTTNAYYAGRQGGVKSCSSFTQTMAKEEEKAQAAD
ncbi:hypothetical protein DRO27_03845 [Candidatus Bathyarchaeota archaeon]|nr:MAG: hypothetical protein DRO27_03845 [Candidatus Bathyarchaeota archaeon]